MTDALEKAIDIAKKLRRAAKKVADPAFQSLITDLSLSLADLKVQMVEQRAGGEQPHDPRPTPAATSEPVATAMPDPVPAAVSPARDAGFGGLRNFPS